MNLKNINVVSNLVKVAGVTGLGLVAYDSHNAGKIESSSYQKQIKANGVTDTYLNTLTQDSPSVLQSKIKKKSSNFRLDENISDLFTGVFGYFKGASSMLVSSFIPLALSVGALVKSKTAIGNVVSKASAAGLLAYGALFVGRDVLGIGKPKQL